MYYNARYYDAALGRFIQPDSIIPNPYNPQSLNRYSYVYNNPLRYTDPTGHCPYCLTVAIGTAVDVAFDFLIAQATKTSFNFGESVALNLGINAATAGIGGKVAKLRHLGKLAGLAEGAAKYGDNVAKSTSHWDNALIRNRSEVVERLGESAFKQIVENSTHRGSEALTVLGHFETKSGRSYVEEAISRGASYFQVLPETIDNLIARGLTNQEIADVIWEANKEFLRQAIQRGDTIVLGTPFERPNSWLAREIQFLWSEFRLILDGNTFVHSGIIEY